MVKLANKVTLARGIAGLTSTSILFTLSAGGASWALAFFLISCVLDKVDGIVARRFDGETKLGRRLDRLTDQVVLFSNLVALASLGITMHVLIAAIIIRELTICELWNYCEEVGKKPRIYAALNLRYLLQIAAVCAGITSLLSDASVFSDLSNVALGSSLLIGLITLLLGIRANWRILYAQK